MIRFQGLSTLGLAAAFVAGCTSAGFVSTWKEPLDRPLEFDRRRVAAVVVTADESIRRAGEGALAREISRGGAQGVASYTLLGTDELQNEETAKKSLTDARVEGAVVMRVVSSGTPEYDQPYYSSFWRYWGYSWPQVYDPGYLGTDTVVMVETLIYSVTDDKLVWAGHSKTADPSDVTKFIQGLAKATRKEMKKSGFID